MKFALLLVCLLLGLSGPAHAQANEADWRWRVLPGDTLIDLANAWLAAPHGWRDLQKLNRVADPLRLQPGSQLRMPLAWLKREAAVAQVQFVKGAVLRVRAGEADTPLVVGAELRSGDTLRTAEQASVSIRLADGSRLLLPPDSELALEQLLVLGRAAIPSTTLRLTRGGAENTVAPNAQRAPLYELKAPRLNLGVRGTEFRVAVGADGATRVQVEQGAVRVAGDAADLSAGQGLVARESSRARAALAPPPDLSAAPRLVERLPMRLSWAAGGATAWRAQVFARGEPQALLLDAMVREASVTWPNQHALPDGDYSLRLRVVDALGLEGRPAQADFALRARPEPPFIQRPVADAVVYAGEIELAWTRNTAAPRARLQIARDAAFNDLVLQAPPLDVASHTARLPAGRYHWRLASVDGERSGPWGDVQSFELREPPPAPPPATPSVKGERLELRWPASPGVVAYEAEWADNEAFTGAQALRSDKPELGLAKPAPGKHYLRVRGLNAAGIASPWGQTQMVEQPQEWDWKWLLPLLIVLLP